MLSEPRLIEGRFPCREVGAETQRERDTGKAPPTHRLHVWWARRPLTPSRAAVLGSILPIDVDSDEFLIEIGIQKYQIIINGIKVDIPRSLVEENGMVIPYNKSLVKFIDAENKSREEIRNIIRRIISESPELESNQDLIELQLSNQRIDNIALLSNAEFPVKVVAANPAWFNRVMEICIAHGIRIPNRYGYDRAHINMPGKKYEDITVFDPTAGGGSIPFEAMRLGCNVVANDLNPVASAVEYATLRYPVIYKKDLSPIIEKYGESLAFVVREKMKPYYYSTELLKDKPGEEITTYLYCRTAVCPHCGERAPLLNAFALQKKADGWMVIPQIEGSKGNKHVRFIPARLINGKGPNGEDPEKGTVKLGTGSCIYCGQAIDSDEIKRQACGLSSHGTWKDELYCVVAQHLIQVKNKNGKTRMTSELYFREPDSDDYAALERAEKALKEGWNHWEALDLIPTERVPEGHKTAEPLRVGVDYWYQMFTPRQLLGHLTAMEALHDMIPLVLNEHGQEKGTAVITYLQYMIDKCLDYSSRQTLWHAKRGVLAHTFTRHDFSNKWTFGEMIFAGPHAGLDWGKDQVLDSYNGICDLLQSESIKPAIVYNGSAANTLLRDKSVDVTCWDPPYYNNVQYAELSDFFYVWQKRTFKNLYPGVFSRLMTNKEDEAVANPTRAGSAKEADVSYEILMGEIFTEIRRVTKDEGIMTMMFTHKSQEAWESLTKALIENGWIITSTMPVESEDSQGIHHKEMAAAVSSIFIVCRKRDMEHEEISTWQGFGQTGVVHQVRQAVRDGLKSYEGLHLNAVDEMVASYGCALKVLSENWPVRDGEEMVSPTKAMREASTVVAQYQMERLTGGQISATDLDAEAGMVMTMLGIYSTGKLPFDDALTLSRSLNVRLENVGVHGYRVDGHMLGIGDEKKDELSYAPVVRKGSNLRILLPEERNPKRLEMPQTEWDILQGVIMAYRDGDIPVARAYLQTHATGSEDKIIALIRVWADNCGKESLKKEADRIVYGLK